MKDTADKLSSLSVSLHWIVGLTMIGLLGLGIYMEENEAYSLYDLHKSLGVIILAFVVIRVLWRLVNRWPSELSDDNRFLKFIARLAHWVLILGTVLIPVSGVMMSGFGGHGVEVFGLELIAGNPDPANPMEVLPFNEALAGFTHSAHGLIANIVIIALLLHIVGAIKHHVVNKDGTLRRMLGKRI